MPLLSILNKKPQRPYLKICKKCGGKGQVSFLDQYQRKTYASCDHCSNGSAPYALGVSVKCVCQKESAPYCWALGFEAKHFKYAMEQEDLRELVKLQKALGTGGTAVLILCDNCGARYLAKDGAGSRRRISTKEKELNDEDKEFNRHIAATMVANGILKDLSTGQVIARPRPPTAPPVAMTSSPAAAGAEVVVHAPGPMGPPAIVTQVTPRRSLQYPEEPVSPGGAVRSGGAPRPMSAPSPRARRAAQQHGGDDTASQVPVPQPLEPVEEGEPGELELLAELPVWVDSPTRHTPAAETPRLQPQPGALNPITPVALH